MNSTLVTCAICGLTQRLEPLRAGTVAECARCGAVVAKPRRHSLEWTAALSLAALLLYVPANVYPVMRMEFQGIFTENTVWDGCVSLLRQGEWFVAGVVFLASIVVPLLKLTGLFFLTITTRWFPRRARRARTWIHRSIEVIGPWAMLDVFLLAIMVALVKFGRFATVTPGPGVVAFASVVILTILASSTFESRQIWQESPTDS